jgi:hypothetical protein
MLIYDKTEHNMTTEMFFACYKLKIASHIFIRFLLFLATFQENGKKNSVIEFHGWKMWRESQNIHVDYCFGLLSLFILQFCVTFHYEM